MGRIVVIANQKGGLGRTTTAVNLGAYLAVGSRVLLVDIDPQANATSSLGVDWRTLERSVYDALMLSTPLESAIIPNVQPGLDLAPAGPALAGAQVELVEREARELRLRQLPGAPPRGFERDV